MDTGTQCDTSGKTRLWPWYSYTGLDPTILYFELQERSPDSVTRNSCLSTLNSP